MKSITRPRLVFFRFLASAMVISFCVHIMAATIDMVSIPLSDAMVEETSRLPAFVYHGSEDPGLNETGETESFELEEIELLALDPGLLASTPYPSKPSLIHNTSWRGRDIKPDHPPPRVDILL